MPTYIHVPLRMGVLAYGIQFESVFLCSLNMEAIRVNIVKPYNKFESNPKAL